MSRGLKTVSLLLSGLLIAALATFVFSNRADAESMIGGHLGQQPIYIESTSLHGFRDHSVYRGNVFVRQDDIRLYCDTLTAYYDADSRVLKNIVAEGHARVTKGDIEAHCGKINFDNIARTLTCEGDPIIRRGREKIEGELLKIWVDEDRWLVERPAMVIDPEKAKEEVRRNEGQRPSEGKRKSKADNE
jgi:lipopolysaccharide transport protein LptA